MQVAIFLCILWNQKKTRKKRVGLQCPFDDNRREFPTRTIDYLFAPAMPACIVVAFARQPVLADARTSLYGTRSVTEPRRLFQMTAGSRGCNLPLRA